MFFPLPEDSIQDEKVKGLSVELLHRLGCNGCALNTPGAKHLEPHGVENPLVYILGEAPGAEEEAEGVPFVGRAGQVLRWRIPEGWEDRLRWNNTIRTRPPENREPTIGEMISCWPSVAGDIAATKPKAIFGFGNIPLWWALKETGITKWRGRRVPVTIKDHTCWYFPMLHPSYIARIRKFDPRKLTEYGSEDEFAFALDLKRAFELVGALPPPIVHTEADARANVWTVDGFGHEHLCRVITFLRGCYGKQTVGFDYETDNDEHSPRPYAEGSRILSVALSHQGGTLAFPINHPKAGWRDQERVTLDQAFREFLYKAPCKKISHNLSFELEWTGHFYGKEALRAQPWEDTLSMAYVLDERRGTLGLEFQCLEHFGLNIKELSNINTKKSLLDVPLGKLLTYNAIDAKYHRLLYLKLHQRLKENHLLDVYKLQLERVPTVVLTQMKGIPVAQDKTMAFYQELANAEVLVRNKIARSDEVKQFKKLKQKEFNPSSVPDVKYVLSNIMGYRNVESTTDAVLSTLKKPFVKLISDYRSVTKMSSTYVLPFMSRKDLLANGEDPKVSCIYPDGLIHHALRTTSTDTSRTSCVRGDVLIPTDQGLTRADAVRTGMKVWTHKNRWRRVTNTFLKPPTDMVSVHFTNGQVLHCTVAHRLFTSYGLWVSIEYVCKELLPEKRNLPKGGGTKIFHDIVDHRTTSQAIPNALSLHSGCCEDEDTSTRTKKAQGAEVLSLETGHQEPYERENWREAPSIQRGLPGWIWVPDPDSGRQTLFLASNRDRESTENTCEGSTSYMGNSPYRRKSIKQPHRQSSLGNTQRAQRNSYAVQERQERIGIAWLEPCGIHPVYDFEVEQDHSYETAGGFSHNSDAPNIQNQPKHGEATIGNKQTKLKEFRSQIRPLRATERIVSFDFGQIQARNVAMESQDENLVKSMWERHDIHADWAERMVRKYPAWVVEGLNSYNADKKVRSHYRQRSKNEFVFASFFGAQAYSSSQRLEIPEKLVEDLLEEFWEEFPGVREWQHRIKRNYRKDGYVTGLSGFRRHAPVSENQLINAPIQADEAAIVLDAMSRLSKLDHDKLQANMEIHDSLDFFWEQSEIEKLSEIVIGEMLKTSFDWARIVPLVVERSIGEDWSNMIEDPEKYASDVWGKK